MERRILSDREKIKIIYHERVPRGNFKLYSEDRLLLKTLVLLLYHTNYLDISNNFSLRIYWSSKRGSKVGQAETI